MLYAILCYNDQDLVSGWTKAEDEAVMANLSVVHNRLYAEGKLGPAGRLGFTGSAKTLVKGQEPPVVMDGPYAETKEAMLGFYIVDCVSMDEALDVARALGEANPTGAYEIRPLSLYLQGVAVGGQVPQAAE
ncbi:YciI family protein [Caulobacter endophyticus]|uniref:YciI family protein n=1 Tax=Caulobacter endophyticus TaxID=2172652 RepID=UPI00240FF7AF|nr:YciI family protein [Caulobacter endophyticus]MDG2529958.1 YciI family protein [Caulobacter endophyticus]